MDHFKLDIEKMLWSYFENEPMVRKVKNWEDNAGDEDTIAFVKKNRKEINDNENPVLKAVLEMSSAQSLNIKPLVYEGVNEKSNSPIACHPLDSGFYLYYNPLLLQVLEENEIRAFVAHELGHYVFPVQITPVKPIMLLQICQGQLSHDQQSLIILSSMLSHLNEYNADRYSLFITRDINLYKSAFPKMAALVRKISPCLRSYEEIEKNVAQDWRENFMHSHPTLNNRIKALQLVEDKLWAPDFNINKEPVLFQQLKDLVSFDKFIENHGAYYEDLKKKSENSEGIF